MFTLGKSSYNTLEIFSNFGEKIAWIQKENSISERLKKYINPQTPLEACALGTQQCHQHWRLTLTTQLSTSKFSDNPASWAYLQCTRFTTATIT